MKKLSNLILLICFYISSSFASDISVTPLYFDMQKDKKNFKKFEISISSNGTAVVNVTPFIAKQGFSGGLKFTQAKSVPVLKLEKSKLIFNRKGTKKLRGQVNFPKNINQTLVYALMIEEEKATKTKGVSISVRYAVVFKIGTSHRRIFEKGSIKDVKLVKIGKKMLLKGTFTNETIKDFQVKTMAYIRDKNNKLMSKVEMKTASSWKKKSDASIVFPKTSVYMVGELRNISKEGDYRITILSRINNKRQFVFKSNLEIQKADIPLVEEKVEKVSFFPSDIKIDIKPKRKSYFRIKLSNDFKKPSSIKLLGESIENSKKKRYIKFFPKEIHLKAGQTKTVLITVENSIDKQWQPKNLKMLIDNSSNESPLEYSIPMNLRYTE